MDTYMCIHVRKHISDIYTHHMYGCIYVCTYMDAYGYICIYGYVTPAAEAVYPYTYMCTHMCKHARMYICIHIYM